MASDAYKRFMDSTRIGLEEWRDGTPYDLEALDDLTQEETNDVIRWVLDRSKTDWRDLQVLAHIGSSVTLFKLEKFLDNDDQELRLHAMDLLLDADPARVTDAQQRVVREIATMSDVQCADRLDSLIDRFNTPMIQQRLLAAAGKSNDFSYHAAAKLCVLRGVIDSEWDWTHRPLFLRLRHGETPADRKQAHEELRALVKM